MKGYSSFKSIRAVRSLLGRSTGLHASWKSDMHMSYGAWQHVRLMLNDNEGIKIYYGTADDYKPLIEHPSNIGVLFKLKDGCKLLTLRCGASTKEYTESKVIEAYNQLGNMGESWSMEVCCRRDYPFCDIIDLCRVAARNGCKLLYFVICQE